MNITNSCLKTLYGQEYADFFYECVDGKTEIVICKDTIYRLEHEMVNRNERLRVLKLNLKDKNIKNSINNFIEITNRKSYVVFIISGYRYPRISSMIGDIWGDDKVEIIPAFKRIKDAPFYNELIIIAY